MEKPTQEICMVGGGGRATFTFKPKRKYKVTLVPLKWEAGEIGSTEIQRERGLGHEL